MLVIICYYCSRNLVIRQLKSRSLTFYCNFSHSLYFCILAKFLFVNKNYCYYSEILVNKLAVELFYALPTNVDRILSFDCTTDSKREEKGRDVNNFLSLSLFLVYSSHLREYGSSKSDFCIGRWKRLKYLKVWASSIWLFFYT